MKKLFRNCVIILLVAGLGLLGWRALFSQEPSYKGKPLSYWIDPPSFDGHETASERSAALEAMSETAVPYLVERLRWKPSPIILRLRHQFPNFPPFSRYVTGSSDPRPEAAHFLGEFGPLAAKAIPDLTAASTVSDLGSSWYPRLCARAALIKIRQEDLAPYIEKLKDTSVPSAKDIDFWYQNALMIGEFGTNAAAAVPNLILALGPTNIETIQAHALLALGKIHSRPEASIPAIVPFLSSPDVGLRQQAVYALELFREAAKPAWPDLIQRLRDPDVWTRRAVTNALKRINPEAAVEAGVK